MKFGEGLEPCAQLKFQDRGENHVGGQAAEAATAKRPQAAPLKNSIPVRLVMTISVLDFFDTGRPGYSGSVLTFLDCLRDQPLSRSMLVSRAEPSQANTTGGRHG